MFCHRPKMFRNPNGCCICETKTSSSRFTASKPYEEHFKQCFNLVPTEERTGQMCNACVLLCKRHLKSGGVKTYERYVGSKAAPRGRRRRLPPPDENHRAAKGKKRPDFASNSKGRRKKSKPKKKAFGALLDVQEFELSDSETEDDSYETRIYYTSSFIDLKTCLPQKTCCGIVFMNKKGEVIVDSLLLNMWDCKSKSNCFNVNNIFRKRHFEDE